LASARHRNAREICDFRIRGKLTPDDLKYLDDYLDQVVICMQPASGDMLPTLHVSLKCGFDTVACALPKIIQTFDFKVDVKEVRYRPPDAGPLHATCARVSRRRSVGKHPTWRISPQTLQVGRMSPRLAGACVQPGSRMPTLSPTSPSLLSGSVDDDIYDICLPDGGPRRVTAVPLGALAGRPV